MADLAAALARYADPHLASGLRTHLGHTTAHLLGATFTVTEEQWRGPSALPDWTRGHVATHLARNADALGRLATGVLTGQPAEMYPSPEARDADIAAGAARDGEQLQTDLDTSAAALDGLLERIPSEVGWDAEVSLRGTAAPVGALLAARLTEVVLHHVDLDIGHGVADNDEDALTAVLDWVAARMTPRMTRSVSLTAGDRAWLVGPTVEDAVEVTGSVPDLLGWLTGRGPAPAGTAAIVLPAY